MRCALLLASGFLVCTPVLAPAAEVPRGPGIFGPETTLADVDRIIDSGKRSMWQVTQSLPQSAETRKGLEADLAEFVFSDAALTRIESLRAKLPAAVIAGSDRIDPAALVPLELVLRQESCKMAAVMMHWS